MRIGIVPFLHNDAGGTYQYSVTMLKALYNWKRDGSPDDFVIFAHDTEHPVLAEFPERRGWTQVPIWSEPPPPPPRVLDRVRRAWSEGPHREAWRWVRRKLGRGPEPEPLPPTVEEVPPDVDGAVEEGATEPTPPPDPDDVRHDPVWESWFRHWGVEFVIHHGPGAQPFEVDVPYVLAIHDLQHRLQPEFPEVSADGEWESREYFFRNACRYATLLLVDSPVGKEDVLNFYGPFGTEPDRVQILPFQPSPYLKPDPTGGEVRRVRAAYELPERYLFYPAQIWPHKNHARLLQAIARLKEQGVVVNLVCCGSAPDPVRQKALADTQELARQLEVDAHVRFLGYVPDQDMSGLFAGAEALVFPTFFGPTNIPPLEAWSLGCPVLTSDIRGIREQMGDAAVLVDPRSVEAMAEGIDRLWRDTALRDTLRQRGQARLSGYTITDFERRVREIVEEAKRRVRAGHVPRVPRA